MIIICKNKQDQFDGGRNNVEALLKLHLVKLITTVVSQILSGILFACFSTVKLNCSYSSTSISSTVRKRAKRMPDNIV